MSSNLQTSAGQDDSREIGVCLSHYHHKLGPQFVAFSFDFSQFDSLSQYNILQDSISSRSNDLALFLDNNHGVPYTVRIKKITILDPLARGGVQRYAVVLIIPSDTPKMEVSIGEIADDLIEKINRGANISQSLKVWHTLLNDQSGGVSTENEIEIVRKLEIHTHPVDLF